MEQRSTQPAGHAASMRGLATAIVATVFAIAGCQSMATTTSDSPPSGSSGADNTVADWPLKFVQHNFGSDCYSVYDCSVSYNGLRTRSGKEGVLQPALADAHPESLGNASADQVGIMNFPPPAQVQWRAKDGTQLEASVDIGEIFKDQVVLHNVPREEVSGSPGTVDILLVVNDRRIDVYMRALVSTNVEQVVGHRRGYSRRELILAWSRTY
jgi:hypothetical protein